MAAHLGSFYRSPRRTWRTVLNLSLIERELRAEGLNRYRGSQSSPEIAALWPVGRSCLGMEGLHNLTQDRSPP
jgi:hypothetical protein